MLPVPQFDFTTFDYSEDLAPAGLSGTGPDILWAWTGPSPTVQRLAFTVMGTGQILSITPPATNASWTQEFWGPALQCNDVTAAERDSIWVNIWNNIGQNPPVFLSWVPWDPLTLVPHHMQVHCLGETRLTVGTKRAKT